MKEYKPNYLNTVIYKLVCNDLNITDVYIGHTTNFKSRMYGHKSSSKISNLKIYQIIRKNGGWNNWKMEIIKNYPCNCLFEAVKEEQYFYNLMKPSMNSTPPICQFDINKPNGESLINFRDKRHKIRLYRLNNKLEKHYNFYKARQKILKYQLNLVVFLVCSIYLLIS